jgi:hypothetical protein
MGIVDSEITGRFCGGTGRCGSSLLGDLLAFHPNVTYFHETRFITDPGGLCDYVEGKVTAGQFKKNFLTRFRPVMLRGIKARNGKYHSRPVLESFFFTLFHGRQRTRAASDFANAIFNWDDNIWVEKTPHSIVKVKTLHKIFPNLRYIHMIREPKDIWASLKTKTWGPKSPQAFVEWYNDLMSRAWKQELRPRQYEVLSLEKLISQPQETLAWIFYFMGISLSKPFPAREMLSFISNPHIGRWKRELTKDEIRIIGDCQKWYEKWKGLEIL